MKSVEALGTESWTALPHLAVTGARDRPRNGDQDDGVRCPRSPPFGARVGQGLRSQVRGRRIFVNRIIISVNLYDITIH